jgi:hypothetical protein
MRLGDRGNQMRTLILLATFAGLTAAQNIQRAVHLDNVSTTQNYQELLTVLRTVADIQDTAMDASSHSVTIGGTAGQIAMSEWLVHLLDQPVSLGPAEKQVRDTATYQYTAPGNVDDVVRVFYLRNVSSPQGVQELLTNLRTVADVMKIFNYTPLTAIALRGPSAQMTMAAWMIEQLDQPGQPAENPAAYKYRSPAGNEELVRVFYLPHINSSRQLNDVLTAVRTKVRIQKAFYYSRPAALVLRGSPDQLAASEILIAQSDLALR